jgi:hypothetical protein
MVLGKGAGWEYDEWTEKIDQQQTTRSRAQSIWVLIGKRERVTNQYL